MLILQKYFTSQKDNIIRGILQLVDAMMRSCATNTSLLATQLAALKNCSFKAADMFVYRLLGNSLFQIDDMMWRSYIKMIFAMMSELGHHKKGEKIYIKVDFTSDKNDFLILCASIICSGRAIPLYFTMRNYPKRAGSYDHKKMELAFLKGLRHALSKKYKYVIVADRGFANDRFINYCVQNNFDYLIRIQPNMMVEMAGKQGICKDILVKNGKYQVNIVNWHLNATIFKHSKNGSIWYIISNISELQEKNAVHNYANRFKIEKCFQDLKSSGFDIESIKIKKYDRFKRWLFLTCFSYAVMLLIGRYINEKMPGTKKNSPIFISLLLASSNWPNYASNTSPASLKEC